MAKNFFWCYSEATGNDKAGALAGCKQNSADNGLHLSGDSIMLKEDRNSISPSKRLSEKDNEKESSHSAVGCLLPEIQLYARRNKSKSNRVSIRPQSNDSVTVGDGNRSSTLPSGDSSRRTKKLYKTASQKIHSMSSTSTSETTSPNVNMNLKIAASSTLLDRKFDVVPAEGKTAGRTKASLPDTRCSFTLSNLHSQSEKYNEDPLSQVEQVPNTRASSANGKVREREIDVSSSHHDILCPPTKKAKNLYTSHQSRFMPPENRKATAFNNTKGFESVFSFNQFCRQLHGTNADCPCSRKLSSSINSKEQTSSLEGILNLDGTNADCPCSRKLTSRITTKEQTLASEGALKLDGDLSKENGALKVVDNVSSEDTCRNLSNNGSCINVQAQVCIKRPGIENERAPSIYNAETKPNDSVSLKRKKTLNNQSGDSSRYKMEGSCSQRRSSRIVNSSNFELPGNTLSRVNSTTAPEVCSSSGDNSKLAKRAHEDFILKEAVLIEDKHKRIAEFSVGGSPLDTRKKFHWDCVLEEMEWLAHDFSQERVWKITAAAQVCHWVASAVRCRVNEQLLCQKQRKVASTMSKAIMKFWQETSKRMEDQNPRQSLQSTVHEYAVRFLKQNSFFCFPLQMGTPINPISDFGVLEIPYVHVLKESLFYTISPNSMERYRNLVESDWPELKRTDRNMHKEKAEASMFGTKAEFQSQENTYEENKEEKDRDNRPEASRACKSLRTSLKGRKAITKSNTAGSNEVTSGLSYKHREGDRSSALMERKPSNILGIGSVPTKRLRTVSRKRVRSLFTHKASGGVQLEKKIDVSSIDASPFQNKQNTWLPSEDQTLLVLVHKLGPNWELVSDAVNSNILAKCNFRKAIECKVRHRVLVEKDAGDEVYLGSSWNYPCTLPDISKDSAQNVSRCLEDTIEVDSLKFHFQKIILIGKQQKAISSQNYNLDRKQTIPVHHSQFPSISQVNSIGRPLTPLDLCDSTTSAPDVSSLRHEECLASGLAHSNMVSELPVYGASSIRQGSGIIPGSSLPSTTLAASTSYSQRSHMPRTPSVLVSQQQDMGPLSKRILMGKTQLVSMSVPGDLPVSNYSFQMQPGENGMHMIHGMNKSTQMPMSRLQELGTIMWPPKSEGQRQMMTQELQVPVAHGSSHGNLSVDDVSQLTGISNQFCYITFQTNPAWNQLPFQMSQQISIPDPFNQDRNHASDPQQQTAMPWLGKERQLREPLINWDHQQKQQQQQWHHPAVFKSSRLDALAASGHNVLSCTENGSSDQQQPHKRCLESSSKGLQPSGSNAESIATAVVAASTVRPNYPIKEQHPRLVKERSGLDTTGQYNTNNSFNVISFPSILESQGKEKGGHSMHLTHKERDK
ncbi:hypothetical protein AQUCO_00700810v1 [Aquilegia coerulea]|uniref:Myb-like domain-containing protein n=1 Tax=Aquilegia coerulea TaxID=218851 RepID=A0A2G5ELV1_AQUCA|nr:hypothetical protein AQUCO_00700810v1 [Aquilegia coerulea]